MPALAPPPPTETPPPTDTPGDEPPPSSDGYHGDLDARLDRCEAVLAYRFEDRTHLRRALTHASVARTPGESNERLEFLGDAVLGAVVCEQLYRRFPDLPEGELTRIKSLLVSRRNCALLTERVGLDALLLVGKGIGGRGVAVEDRRVPRSILANAFEAVVAAVFLDGGYAAASDLLTRVLADDLAAAGERGVVRNFKSRLQHVGQKRYGATPGYAVLSAAGPDHAKQFEIAAQIADRRFPSAWGASKKAAEQAAAEVALETLAGEERAATADRPLG